MEHLLYIIQLKNQKNNKGLPAGVYEIFIDIDGELIKDMPQILKIKKYSPEPQLCIASGQGLTGFLTTQEKVPILIQTHNTDGPVTHGGENIKVQIKYPNGSQNFIEVKDQKNGTYEAPLFPLPKVFGTYIISITLDDIPIKNSPFTVNTIDQNEEPKCTIPLHHENEKELKLLKHEHQEFKKKN